VRVEGFEVGKILGQMEENTLWGEKILEKSLWVYSLPSEQGTPEKVVRAFTP